MRGVNSEGAGSVLTRVSDTNRYRFDQACRVKVVQLAARLAIDSHRSINFLLNAVYRPELCIRTTLEAAATYGSPHERIIIEVTEGEQISDHAHLLGICVIAGWIEAAEELKPLRDFGITLFQGHYFAQPQTEGLAAPGF